MTTIDAATSATRTHSQTGPRTEAGKAKSSRNAIRTGMYAARDFVRPDEEEEYAKALIQLMDELTPDGAMEQTFATEIMGATWRLRRCRLVEEAFSSIEDLNCDPMVDERTEKQQKNAGVVLISRRCVGRLHEKLRQRDKYRKVGICLTQVGSKSSLRRGGGIPADADGAAITLGGYLLHSGNRRRRPGREPHIGFRRRRPRYRALSPPVPIASLLFLQRSADAT
jgi:hypothetical protein